MSRFPWHRIDPSLPSADYDAAIKRDYLARGGATSIDAVIAALMALSADGRAKKRKVYFELWVDKPPQVDASDREGQS